MRARRRAKANTAHAERREHAREDDQRDERIGERGRAGADEQRAAQQRERVRERKQATDRRATSRGGTVTG